MKSPTDLAAILFLKGDHDLETAGQVLGAGRPLDTACFHLQQAVEKHLKAFLALANIEYPHTHDLDELFDLCAGLTDALEPLRAQFSAFAPYAVQLRYYDVVSPNVGEVRAGLESVLALRAKLASLVPAGTFSPLEPDVESKAAELLQSIPSAVAQHLSRDDDAARRPVSPGPPPEEKP